MRCVLDYITMIGKFCAAFVVVLFASPGATFAANDLDELAKCLPTKYPLERDARAKNIGTILEYGDCVKQQQRGRIGKWFCFVSTMVGIQVDKEGGLASGNIKPTHDKFFINIKEVNSPQKQMACEFGEFGLRNSLDQSSSNRCLANFELEFAPDVLTKLQSSDSYVFKGKFSEAFILYGTNDFVLIQQDYGSGSNYLARGRCEKID
jgi:hypothetical protein